MNNNDINNTNNNTVKNCAAKALMRNETIQSDSNECHPGHI